MRTHHAHGAANAGAGLFAKHVAHELAEAVHDLPASMVSKGSVEKKGRSSNSAALT